MKEDQQFVLMITEALAAPAWPEKQLPELQDSRQTFENLSLAAILNRTSGIILLFLDIARETGDAAFLAVAKAGARYLTDIWDNLGASPEVLYAADNPTVANGFSRAAFALVHAWKTTPNPVYRDAGLDIIRRMAGTDSASGRGLNSFHGDGKQWRNVRARR